MWKNCWCSRSDCALPSPRELRPALPCACASLQEGRAGVGSSTAGILVTSPLHLDLWSSLPSLAGCRSPSPPCRGLPAPQWSAPAVCHCWGSSSFTAQLQGCEQHTAPQGYGDAKHPQGAPCLHPKSSSPCTPKGTLDIVGSALVPAHRDVPSCLAMGLCLHAGLGDICSHPRVLAHLPRCWDSCVCSAPCSESLLCFVCPSSPAGFN